MRAREPDSQGFVERDGVRLFYEVHGDGAPSILLLPGWTLPARSFKGQIPFLARHYRVVAADPRGTGSSDKPNGPAAYALDEYVADALAVLDATGTDRVVVLSKSRGAQTATVLAGDHPDRVAALVVSGGYLPLTPWHPIETVWKTSHLSARWRRRLTALRLSGNGMSQLRSSPALRRAARRLGPFEAAVMFSQQQMRDDFDSFADWFVDRIVATDPHSTKQSEDAKAWMHETTGDVAADSWAGDHMRNIASTREAVLRVRCPVLAIHGEHDLTCPVDWGRAVAEITGGQLFEVPEASHLPGGRYPVVVNLALRRFIDSLPRGESGA